MQGELPATIIQNDKGDGILPPERFADAGEVSTYCRAMIFADGPRSKWRAKIDGIVNGNQPINPNDLRAKQMAWYPNVNYREMEGILNAQQTPFYDLVTEANPCIELDIDWGKGQDPVNWANIIADEFTWLLMKRWRKSMNFHIPMQQLQMLKHGIGTHVWPQANVNNWIPRTSRAGMILFPENTGVDFENDGEAFLLRDFVPLHALYNFIRNEKAATDLGWIPKNLWKAMALTGKMSQTPYRGFGADLEQFQSRMKRGDLGASNTNTSSQSGMWVDWLFVRELDTGKISLYAVPESLTTNEYIFKKRNRFDSWPLSIFNYDVGDGFLHTIRGLGSRTANFFELSNRVKNAMAAQVILGTTVQVQQTGNVDPDKLKLMKLGIMSLLPQGVTLQQGFKFQDLGQGPLALLQDLKGTLRENNESYMSGTPEPKDRETAQSFTMRSQDAAQVSKGTHGLYGSNLCDYYTRTLKMVIGASKMSGNQPYVVMAKEFRDRCRKQDVPDECFDHVEEVREVTSTGAGSAAARIQALMTIMQYIYPVTSEDRKINIERDLTGTLVSGTKVDRYARSQNDNQLPDSDDSMIAVENNGLTQGGSAVVSPTQNHVQHSQGHLAKAMEIVQALQQGQIDPQQALASIQAIGQHVSQHLQQIQGNPGRKQEFEQLSQELNSLSAIADQLQNNLDEQANSQQPNPEEQISDNLKIGLAKVQSGHQIKSAALQSNIQLKRVKTAADIQDRFRQTQFDNRIKLLQAPKKQAA